MDTTKVTMVDGGVRIDFTKFKVGDYIFIDVTRDSNIRLNDNYAHIEFICNMYIEIKTEELGFRYKIKYKDILHIGRVTRYC